MPRARLEVYWLGDEPEPAPERTLIREYAAEAAELLRAGHPRAAVAIAWSAPEGAFIYYAAESGAPLPEGEPPSSRHGRCCHS